MDAPEQILRVLFVENAALVTERAKREIAQSGIIFTDEVVRDESAFRHALEEFAPDLVISDYFLPEFGGRRALKITRSYHPYLPFIFLADEGNAETVVACMKAGAGDYILKKRVERLPESVRTAIREGKERREKELNLQQLRQSLKEYRDLIDGMNETVWVFTPDGRLIDVNEKTVELLGYTKEELLRIGVEGVDKFLTPEEISAFFKKVSIHKTQTRQSYLTSKSGKEIPVEFTSSLTRYAGEEVITTIARDITERIEVQRQLKLLSRAVEEIPVSIIITDAEGHIEYINPTFSKITGYKFHELKGKTPRVFKSGKQSDAFYKNLWDTVLAGKEWHGRMANKKKNGELYWEDISISPIPDDKGIIRHFVSVREDVTRKKKMVEDLIAAKNKAEESDRLKSAFLANVSHEIRTPMNGIMGFTELLKEPQIKYLEKNKYVNIIQKSGERMLETINNLIEISKIESGMMKADCSSVNINRLISYFCQFFRPEAQNKGLKIACFCPLPDVEAFINTDKEKLNSIFMNLIKNAVKYTHEGIVEFGYRIKDSRLECFVKDTGIGIEKERQTAIFDRFSQADPGLSRPYEGAGLGLSITKAYVRMLGGIIHVESEPGKGSTFTFTLPLREVKKTSDAPHENR